MLVTSMHSTCLDSEILSVTIKNAFGQITFYRRVYVDYGMCGLYGYTHHPAHSDRYAHFPRLGLD